MHKIPTVFRRNPENMREITREVNPECQWVLDGEGVATRKYDGTCVMLDENKKWWARREVKPGKPTPEGWMPVETDDVTGKIMGWVPITPQGYGHPLLDALGLGELAKGFSEKPKLYSTVISDHSQHMEPGTYELCGPKINGNPEGYVFHVLINHNDAIIQVFAQHLYPLTYDSIKTCILLNQEQGGWEGLVWHHPDGRMAKMKARDYKIEKEES